LVKSEVVVIKITKRKIILLAIILIGLIVSLWYKLPYEINKTYKASTIDGITVNLTIKMKGYRNFFSPTNFVGEVMINGDIYETIKVDREENFLQRFDKKIRGIREYPYILNKDQNGLVTNHDLFEIIWTDEEFNELYFVLIKKDDEKYFAPANNSIEAEELQRKIFQKMVG